MQVDVDAGETSSVAVAVPPLAGIQHVGLTVRDVDASEAWYGRVLGLRRLFAEDHHGGGGGWAVVLGGEDVPLNIGLEHHPDRSLDAFDERRTGLDHLCLQVPTRDDLDRWVLHLDEQGVPHSEVTDLHALGMVFSIVSFRDPDGIALELMAVA